MEKNILSGLSAEKKYATIKKLIQDILLNSNHFLEIDEEKINKISGNTDCFKDLGFDDLYIITLVMDLEQATKITISNEDASKVVTIDDIIQSFIKNAE